MYTNEKNKILYFPGNNDSKIYITKSELFKSKYYYLATAMKKLLLVATFSLLFISCGDNDKPDVIKFKSGAYGSKEGQFMANFPGKPKAISQHYQLGAAVEFDEYFFQYNVGNEHVYSVSYVDFPKSILDSWDTEQLFDQSIKTLNAQLDDFKVDHRKVKLEKGFEKSITYTLYSDTPGAMMKAKMLKKGDRIYRILFSCIRRQPEHEQIDNFINSFRILRTK